jgi:small subunit ribosomal protein S21
LWDLKGVVSMAVNAVVRVSGDNIDSALRFLKKKIEREGLIKDIKRHSYYEKPAEVKRKKLLKAKRKHQKIMRKMQQQQKYL